MKILLVILLSFNSLTVPPPDVDYCRVFGDNYTWAEKWFRDHDHTIERLSALYEVPSREIKAVVFPELIRYNIVFDALQVESLKFLYVSEGKSYADFSVGYFQMKPSFAEMVEEDAERSMDQNVLLRKIQQWHAVTGEQAARRERVRRITSIEDQLAYLCAFYKICQWRFPQMQSASAVDRVRFFATCYNAGYRRSKAEIVQFQTRNYFYRYNYSDVSAHYFMGK